MIGKSSSPGDSAETPESAAGISGSGDDNQPTADLYPSVTVPSAGSIHPAGPEADALLGTVLEERYEILERVGQGGMGTVFRARHRVLGTMVAVKVLGESDPVRQQRFLREAQLASKVQHPNTVYISDFGLLADGRPFLVMEFIAAPTLNHALVQGRMDPLRACEIGLQIARGMQPIHDKGIVHRDLKPDNIFLLAQEGSGEFVKIVDFGIAKQTLGSSDSHSAAEVEEAHAASMQSARDLKLPLSALETAISGTPAYMPPEQAQGQEIDARTDQYALGCILYRMLTGTVPFLGISPEETVALHINATVEPPEQRVVGLQIPATLSALVLRCLAKDRDQRFPSMRELAKALEQEIERLRLERGERVVMRADAAALLPTADRGGLGRRRVPLWLVAPLFALVIAGGLFLNLRRFRPAPARPTLRPGELLTLEKRATAVLGEYLKAPNRELRMLATSALGKSNDSRLYSLLTPLLSDGEPEVRAQAAEALGQLGERKAAPALGELLAPTQLPNVQVAAAAALAQLGDDQGSQYLRTALTSKEKESRLRAAFYLCDSDRDAQALLKTVLDYGKAPEPTTLNILTCLTRGGDAMARQQLASWLGPEQGVGKQLPAAARLYRCGDARGKELLQSFAKKPGPQQLIAARLLAAPTEPETAELFRRVVDSKQAEPAARMLAAEGLGDSGQALDARLLGPWVDAAQDAPLRIAAAGAILLLAQNDPGILSENGLFWARSALSDKDWHIREAAVAALGDLPSDQAPVLLAQALQDGETVVRQVAARALGRRLERASLLALRDGLHDKDAVVREEALRSLGAAGASLLERGEWRPMREILDWLTEYLQRATESEQVIVRGALMRLGDTSQKQQLLALIHSESSEVRQRLVSELEHDTDALLQLLADSVFSVRFGAAKKLAELNDRRALPVLREAQSQGGGEAVVAYGLLASFGEKVPAPDLAAAPREQRLQMVDALSELRSDLALPLLRAAVEDADAVVRRHAVEVASLLVARPRKNSPAAEVLSLLRGLLHDSDAAVRVRSAALLSRAELLAPSALPSKPTADGGVTSLDASAPVDLAKPAPDLEAAAPSPKPETPPKSETPAEPEPIAAGSGQILFTSEHPISFQLDHRPWQALTTEPIVVPAGPHTVTTLDGEQEISVTAGQKQTVALAESPIEELARLGLAATEHAPTGSKKAQKQLEKAKALCGHARKQAAACAPLMFLVSTRLAGIYESQQRWAEAMTEYQNVVQLAPLVKGKSSLRDEAQSSIERLTQHLGQIIIPRTSGRHCTEVSLWMRPGTHLVVIEGKSETVTVRARETVKVGSCP